MNKPTSAVFSFLSLVCAMMLCVSGCSKSDLQDMASEFSGKKEDSEEKQEEVCFKAKKKVKRVKLTEDSDIY